MRYIQRHHLIYACIFFFCLGGNILNFSLVYRLTDWFLFSPGQIGFFLGLGQIVYFLGSILYLRFGSSLNPIRILPVSSVVAFLAVIPLSYVRLPLLLYTSYWLLQLCTSFFWPPVLAYLTEGLTGKALNRKISIYSRSWMSAVLVGPIIAGTLYRWNSFLNFTFLNICFFLAVLIFFIMKLPFRSYSQPDKETYTQVKDPETEVQTQEKNIPPEIRIMNKRMDLFRYRGWMSNFCSTMCLGILTSIIPLHIRDGLGYTERAAGMVLFFRCALGFIGFTILARFTAWHFKRWWFIVTQSCLTLIVFLFLFAGSNIYFYFFIAGLYGLMNASCNVTSVFYSGVSGNNNKKNMTLHEIFLALGTAFGSSGGGLLYQHFRLTGMCLTLAFILVMGIVTFVIIGRKERPPAQTEPE